MSDDLTRTRDALISKIDMLVGLSRSLEAGSTSTPELTLRKRINETAKALEALFVSLIDNVDFGAPISTAPVDLDDVKSAFVQRVRENDRSLPSLTEHDRMTMIAGVI